MAPTIPNQNAYLRKPWLALYPTDWPATIEPEFADMLSMFRAAVTRRRDAMAIAYFDGALTYDDLDRMSDALGSWIARQGIGRGERAAVIVQNIPQFVIFVIAAWKCGVIPVPCNPMYRPAELAKLFVDCEPRLVLVEDGNVEVTREAMILAGNDAPILSASALEFQVRNDPRILAKRLPRPAGAVDFIDALAAHEGQAPDAIEPEVAALGLLVYTSGTTGLPKGAMLGHASLAYNAQSIRELTSLDTNSRILGIAPLFHITGFTCHFGAMLSAGCCMILHYRVHPSVVLDAIREHRPTYTIGAITAFNALLSDPGFCSTDFSSFERAISGGAPVPQALREKIAQLTGLRMEIGYGMTETCAQTVQTPPGRDIPVDPASGALSIGVPTPGTEILIVDEQGAPVPVGERGELWMRGAQVMAGYWQKPQETAATLSDGWMHSGDVALMDEAGWLYLVDRQKDVIIASGFKVWPREVEDVLYAHPAIREAAVVGVADDYRGETVKACVSLNQGHSVSVDELLAYCRERLAAYKQPRIVEVVEELPKTATGKIQRNVIRERSHPT